MACRVVKVTAAIAAYLLLLFDQIFCLSGSRTVTFWLNLRETDLNVLKDVGIGETGVF